MHSRIYQLLPEYVPDKTSDMIMTEGDMEDGFVSNISDYVSTDCNRVEDFGWLSSQLRSAVGDAPESWDKHVTCYYAEEITPEALASVGVAENVLLEAYFVFRSTYKEEYFRKRLEAFMNLTTNLTIERFADSLFVYNIEQCLDASYSSYITGEDKSYQTLDCFVRNELEFGKECKFWLGSTLDYHC